MPRIRSIKYEFFINEELSQTPPLARLLALGLTVLADREGRLEDRPLRLKAQLFPYEEVNCDHLLNELVSAHFIERYSVGDLRYIQILNFSKHQQPHLKEKESVIPAREKEGASREKEGASREKEGASREKEGASREKEGTSHAVFGILSLGSGIRDPDQKPARGRARARLEKPKPLDISQTDDLPYQTTAFIAAFTQYERWRKAAKRPITPETRALTLAELEEMGEEPAIAALEHSMAQGYIGFSSNGGSSGKQQSQYETNAERNARVRHDSLSNYIAVQRSRIADSDQGAVSGLSASAGA
jgi:hypothetical protein